LETNVKIKPGWDAIRFSFFTLWTGWVCWGIYRIKIFVLGCRKRVLECRKNLSQCQC